MDISVGRSCDAEYVAAYSKAWHHHGKACVPAGVEERSHRTIYKTTHRYGDHLKV